MAKYNILNGMSRFLISLIASRQKWMSIIGLFLVFIVVLQAQIEPVKVTAAWVVVWGLGTGLFVLADILPNTYDHSLWMGYQFFAVSVTWMILGLLAAVLLVMVALLVVAVGRGRRFFPRENEQPALSQAMLTLSRFVIYGGNLLLLHMISQTFDVAIPLRNDSDYLGLLVALLIGLFYTWVMNSYLHGQQWSFQDAGRLTDVILLIAIIPMAHVYQDSGVLVYLVLMGGIGIQAVRYAEAHVIENKLSQREEELTLLRTVGNRIADNLVLDDVLDQLYSWVCELVKPQVFYVGLIDTNTDSVRFPRVIVNGEQVNWDRQHLGNLPFIQRIIPHRKVLVLRRSDEFYFDNMEPSQDQFCISVPLLSGDDVTGVMTLVVASAKDVPGSIELGALQTIANQSGLALRNATLFEKSVSLAQNLTEINKSVQDVMFNLDENDAMNVACQTALGICNAQRVAIFLNDQDDKAHVRLVHTVGLTEDHIAYYKEHNNRPNIWELTPRIVSNIQNLAQGDPLSQLAWVGNFQAMAEIPLKSGSALVGLLLVFHDMPHDYESVELELLETLAHQITAAIDYTDLLSALELYASEQAQLVHLSRISTASLDLEKIVDSVTNILQQMMNLSTIQLGLLEDNKRLRFLQQNRSSLEVDMFPELSDALDYNHAGPQVYYVNDVDISPNLRQFMNARNDATLMLVPMIANNVPLGLVTLSDQSAYHFSDSEWRLMEMATNLLATQIHNAQLYRISQDALDRRLQQLSLIEDIAQQISASLNLDVIIHNVLEAAIRATQADTATLGLITENGEFRIITRELYQDNWYQYESQRNPVVGLMGYVMTNGETLVVGNNQPYNNYIKLDQYQASYQSSAVVPLKIETDGRVMGVLNVESVQPDFFNEEHVEFIKNLAGHSVISIQNARLLDERQAQIETLTELRELSLALSSMTDKQAVTRSILQTAIETLNGLNAILFYYHQETDELVLLSSMRREDGIFTNARTFIPDEIAYRAAQTNTMQVVEDITQDSDFQRYDFINEVDYASLLAAPIKRGGEATEVMCVTLPTHRPYIQADLNIFELLIIQAAGHLENAYLYEQISSQSDRTAAILESTRDGIILLDRAGVLLEANLSAESILNIRLEEYVGRPFADTLLEQLENREDDKGSDLDEALKDMARILRLEPQRITTRSYTLSYNGKPRHIVEIGSPVMDNHNHIIGRLLTLRDVTEEKLLEEYRDEITGMVIHDLRGPLSSIISSITLTMEIANEVAGEAANDTIIPLMDVSLDSASNLLQLVDSLLDIAKMETRRMPLERRPTSVVELVESATRQLQTTMTEVDVQLTTIVPENLPLVDVDSDKIRRVIVNVLDNALRFTPHGGEVMISVALAGPRKVVIRVADSGPGIPSEEVDRVFEKFRQVLGSKPLHGRKGTGLGLTFCKLAIEAHGEIIWIEQNGPLSGACFAFTLPVGSEEPSEEPDAVESTLASI